MTTGEKIRDIKRPYRKKAFQSGYSQKGNAVQSNPPPISSYSTVSTAATQVVRAGVDPQTFRRPVRSTPQGGLEGIPIDFSNYPWHMVSKGNSANLIQRQRIDFTTLDTYDAAGVLVTANSFDNNSYVDMVVINVADVLGDDTWRDSTGDWNSGPVTQMAIDAGGIEPAKADLTFTAYAPSAGIFYKFVITASTLTLTGKVPANGEGFVISPDNASIEIVQTYSWANYGGTWAASSDNWDNADFIPTAVETGQNQPDAGSLTLSGSVPDWNLSQLWYVPSGSLALTGFLPLSTTGHIFTPAKAELTGLGTTSWADTSGDWASS